MLMPNVSKYAGVTMFTPAPGRRRGIGDGPADDLEAPGRSARPTRGMPVDTDAESDAGQRRRAVEQLAIERLDLLGRGQVARATPAARR